MQVNSQGDYLGMGRGRGIVAHSRLLHDCFMSKGSHMSTHAPSHLRRTCGEGEGVGVMCSVYVAGVGVMCSVYVAGVGAGCM